MDDHRRMDHDWDGPTRRPAWVRWVAAIAALALVVPLAAAAIELFV